MEIDRKKLEEAYMVDTTVADAITKMRFVEDDILARDNEKYKKESQSYYLQLDPKEVKLTLMSNEIGNIIDELGRVQHDIFELMGYDKLIKKLREALK